MANVDWKSLLKLVAPVAGTLAAGRGPGQTGFMTGFMRGQQRALEQKQLKAEQATKQRDLGSRYAFDVFDKLDAIDDPIQWAQLRDLAIEHAPEGVDHAEFQRMTFPESKVAEKRLTELVGQLDALEKGGYDIDQLAESGSKLHLKDGTQVPIASALELTRRRPVDAGGKPVARPKKSDAAASTDYGRFLAKYAKGKGKSVDDLSAAEELDAKKVYGQADDKPRDTSFDDVNKTLKELQVEAARQRIAAGNGTKNDEALVQITETDPDTGEIVTSLVPRKAGEVSRKPPAEPNQSQYAAGNYASRMEQAERVLGSIEASIASMNPVSFNAQKWIDQPALQSDAVQSYMQAARNFINAVLRRESGAAIAASEFAEARSQYLPQPGDSPETLTQKKANRELVFRNMKQAGGRAYQPAVMPSAKKGDKKEIPGYPGTEQTYDGAKWVRTK